jgi:biopolymer transport protein ExbD
MKFYPRRRRNAPAVIIISLIDVLIVMVVFLLASTTFKGQPQVKIALPEASETPKPGGGNEKPGFAVSVVQGPPFFYIGNRPITEDKLFAELKAARSADPQLHLEIRADKDASVGRLVRLVQFAKQADIKNPKILTQSPGKK